MKNSLFLILFSTLCFVGQGQMKDAKILLKSGETLIGIGKITKKNFRYKSINGSKTEKIPFDDIEFVKLKSEDGNFEKSLFFVVKGSSNIIAVQEGLFVNEKVAIYKTVFEGFYSINHPSAGLPFNQITYYVKRKSESVLTKLGGNTNSKGKLKKEILSFFNDCNSLISKIEAKEFKVKTDIEKIVEFYNKNCE